MYKTVVLRTEDFPAFDRFLTPHTPWLYFMRSNIRRAGLNFYGEPYQAEYLAVLRDNAICGVIAHSWLGSLQCFIPDYKSAPALFEGLTGLRRRHPRPITCLLGVPDHVELLHRHYDFYPKHFRDRNGLEDLYSLTLVEMKVPPLLQQQGVRVRLAAMRDAELLIGWRCDFNVEAIGERRSEEMVAKARTEIERRIDEADLYLLEIDGQVVSFCGAGGFLQNWKIVGPVWTPPALRGKGYARAVVAGALQKLQANGTRHTVLFTGNPLAARAYQAIGFVRIGDWRLDYFKTPITTLPDN